MEEVQVLHIRNYNYPEPSARKHNRGGATIAMRRDEVGNYHVEEAFCNMSDNFCARIGRAVALGRLSCNRHEHKMFSNKKALKDHLHTIVSHYGDSHKKLDFIEEI